MSTTWKEHWNIKNTHYTRSIINRLVMSSPDGMIKDGKVVAYKLGQQDVMDDITENNKTIFLKFSPQLIIINNKNIFRENTIKSRTDNNIGVNMLGGKLKNNQDKLYTPELVPYAIEFPTHIWTEESVKYWYQENKDKHLYFKNKKHVYFQTSKFENAYIGTVDNFSYRHTGTIVQPEDKWNEIYFDIKNEQIDEPLNDRDIKDYIEKCWGSGWYIIRNRNKYKDKQ